MKKLAQFGVLCKLTNCDEKDVIKHSKNVYEWRGIFYEICGSKSRTAPGSHYTTIEYAGKKWSIRELGDKSTIIKNMKG